MGRGPETTSQPLFLLAQQTDSQKLATLWSISPTQALFSTHLSKERLIKQKEHKVGGGCWVRGDRNLARVALEAQALLA